MDGDLSDWTSDGLFRSEREGPGASQDSLEGGMRYDANFLHIAAHLGDPAPMRNTIDPATDAELGCRGGGL